MLLSNFHIIWSSGLRGKAVLEIENSHRGPSIDASYQVSVYLAKRCQGRRFLEIDQSEKRIV